MTNPNFKRRHAITQAEIAKRCKVSVTTWKLHVAAGCPVPKSKAKRSLDKWQREYEKWRVDNAKLPSTDARSRADPARGKWELEQKKWAAIERKIRVGVLARRLVDRSEVEERTVRQILVVRQALNDAVRKLAPRVFDAPNVEDVELELQAEVDHICESFASGLKWSLDDGEDEGSAALDE